MKEIVEYNKLKRLELMTKLLKSRGNYRLFCIDVDDVIFNTDPLVQQLLEIIDHRATKKYREEIAHETSEDMRDALNKSFDILDAILEETIYVDYDDEKEKTTRRSYKQLDYNEIYQDNNLISGSVDFIKNMLANRLENDYFIFLSHKNPEREGVVKTKKLYELFPEIDAVETLPFHVEAGSKRVNSKALWIKQVYGLENLDNCYLLDNSRSNCKDFRKHGGNFIRYLPESFDKQHTLADHMSKLDSLDPYMFQFAMSFIDYTRGNVDYLSKVDIPMNEVKEKVKKL